jgi:hypothetical protein
MPQSGAIDCVFIGDETPSSGLTRYVESVYYTVPNTYKKRYYNRFIILILTHPLNLTFREV